MPEAHRPLVNVTVKVFHADGGSSTEYWHVADEVADELRRFLGVSAAEVLVDAATLAQWEKTVAEWEKMDKDLPRTGVVVRYPG